MSARHSNSATSADALVPTNRFLELESRGEISRAQGESYRHFLKRVSDQVLSHPIVSGNSYTTWFEAGQISDEQLRHFTVQFSVFSNQFLLAQLKKMIESESLDGMRSAKEILANEIGAVFRPLNRGHKENPEGVDPEVVGIEGTVDGGRFHFRAAHFEWLVDFAKPLGLRFQDLGKRRHGTKSTLAFCDALIEIYGNEDPNVGSGAGFAIENWAAAGFWQQLEDGLRVVKQKRHSELSLGFWSWHNRIEAQHAGHTVDELESSFLQPGFDEQKFLSAGGKMLEALHLFWEGLENDRLAEAN